ERAPGEEREAELVADVDLGPAAAERRGELVLHAHEVVAEHRVGRTDLVGVDVGETDGAHLAGVRDLAQHADRLRPVPAVLGAVVLPQPQLLDTQPAQAVVARLPQVLWRAVATPAAAVGTGA